MQTHVAHPTVYNGCQFRSRLEARWAAFFDIAGWHWDYEPFDLEGWTPDFLLRGAHSNTLVEVKPIDWTQHTDVGVAALRGDLAKARFNAPPIMEDAESREVVILGAYPFRYNGFSAFGLGLILNEEWGGEDVALICKGHNRLFDFTAESGAYRYRIGGEWDGDHHLLPIWDHEPDVDMAWRSAGMRTQWKPPTLRPAGDIIKSIVDKLKPGGES